MKPRCKRIKLRKEVNSLKVEVESLKECKPIPIKTITIDNTKPYINLTRLRIENNIIQNHLTFSSGLFDFGYCHRDIEECTPEKIYFNLKHNVLDYIAKELDNSNIKEQLEKAIVEKPSVPLLRNY